MSNTLESSKSIIPLPEGVELDKTALELIKAALNTHVSLYAKAERKRAKVFVTVEEYFEGQALVTEVVYTKYQLLRQATVGGIDLYPEQEEVIGLAVDKDVTPYSLSQVAEAWSKLAPEHQEALKETFPGQFGTYN